MSSKIEFFTNEVQKYNDIDEEWIDSEITEEILWDRLSKIESYTFADYIRKYMYKQIFEKEGLEFASISDSEYQKEANKIFRQNGVSTKNNFFKNNSVESTRSMCIDWIFGLNMDIDTAELFFKKALRQRSWNCRDPYEVICYYCLKERKGYSEVERYLKKYVNECVNNKDLQSERGETNTEIFQNDLANINSDEKLWAYLTDLTIANRSRGILVGDFSEEKDVTNNVFYNNHIRKTYELLLSGYKKSLKEGFELSEAVVHEYNFWSYIKHRISDIRVAEMESNDADCWCDRLDSDEKYIEAVAEEFVKNGMEEYVEEAKNYIRERAIDQFAEVDRKMAFLVVFGLGMDKKESSYFLKNVLLQKDFYWQSPYEIICQYCIQEKLKYGDVITLLDEYVDRYLNKNDMQTIETVTDDSFAYKAEVFREELRSIDSEEKLYAYLEKLTTYNMNHGILVSTNLCSRDVIEQTCIYDYGVSENELKHYFEDIEIDVLEACLENDSIFEVSKFINNRLNYYYMDTRLEGKQYVDREDIILLAFLNYIKNIEKNNKTILNMDKDDIYDGFVDSVNIVLDECGMQEFYLPNAFEMFLAVSIYSNYSLETLVSVITIQNRSYTKVAEAAVNIYNCKIKKALKMVEEGCSSEYLASEIDEMNEALLRAIVVIDKDKVKGNKDKALRIIKKSLALNEKDLVNVIKNKSNLLEYFITYHGDKYSEYTGMKMSDICKKKLVDIK